MFGLSPLMAMTIYDKRMCLRTIICNVYAILCNVGCAIITFIMYLSSYIRTYENIYVSVGVPDSSLTFHVYKRMICYEFDVPFLELI